MKTIGIQVTTEEEEDLTLPLDSIHRAQLEELKLRTMNWTDRDSGQAMSKERIEWWWRITASQLGDKYIGRRVKGECDKKISTRSNDPFRNWAEALLDREIPAGMVIDTDDLIGLQAEIQIGHRQDKKDPLKTWEFVSQVFPYEMSIESEPPF